MGQFPSLKASDLQRMLKRELGYEVVRQKGSHKTLESEGRPPLTFAFHDGQTIPPMLVKKILTRDVGLSEDEAKALL